MKLYLLGFILLSFCLSCSSPSTYTDEETDIPASISKERAQQIAEDYVKTKKTMKYEIPINVSLRNFCNVYNETSRTWEKWQPCFVIEYDTPKSEARLLGNRAVVVSGDGKKVAFATRD